MPSGEVPPDPYSSSVFTGFLGLVGAILSLLFGGHDLNVWQRLGCLLAGVSCAVVFGPLVLLMWSACPPQVVSAVGFIFGLGGLFIVRALLRSWGLAEGRLPGVIGKIVKNKTGIDPIDPPALPTPPPPSPPSGGS